MLKSGSDRPLQITRFAWNSPEFIAWMLALVSPATSLMSMPASAAIDCSTSPICVSAGVFSVRRLNVTRSYQASFSSAFALATS